MTTETSDELAGEDALDEELLDDEETELELEDERGIGSDRAGTLLSKRERGGDAASLPSSQPTLPTSGRNRWSSPTRPPG